MTQEYDTRELILESDTREKLDSDTTHVGAHISPLEMQISFSFQII